MMKVLNELLTVLIRTRSSISFRTSLDVCYGKHCCLTLSLILVQSSPAFTQKLVTAQGSGPKNSGPFPPLDLRQ